MTTITGSEALMQILLREEVEYVFGLPGTTELLFMDALEDHPEIKYVLGLHEAGVVGMAEGYARISGKPGVVNLHTYAGLTAAAPALLNAFAGGVPLLVTAGQQDTRMHLQEPHLAGDLTGFAKRFTKWNTEINFAEDIPVALRRAFKVAMQPPTGPVFVSLPVNVMADSLQMNYRSGTPVFTRTRPDADAIAAAVKLLVSAENPILLVEGGVSRNDALDEVVVLAETLGAPVYQGWMGDVNFPTGHPQYLGDLAIGSPPVSKMLESVDVLVVVGAPLFAQPFYLPGSILSAKTRIIHIDDNPWEIGKNYPLAAGICGHIKTTLAELNEAVEKRMTATARKAAKARASEVAREKEAMKAAFAEQARQERDHVPIAVSRLMQELKEALSPDTILVDESVSCSGVLRHTIEFNEPLSYKMMRGGGSIGWGLPAAIGAKLAAPERPVVALSGDGAALWSIQSLWTAANHHLPVTFIICANAGYGQLGISKRRVMGEKGKGRYLGLRFSEPRIDFLRLAEGMGIAARRAEHPDELGDALQTAMSSDEPQLVEVRLADAFNGKD